MDWGSRFKYISTMISTVEYPLLCLYKIDNNNHSNNNSISNNNNNNNSSSVVGTTGLPIDWGHGFDPRLHAPIIMVGMILIAPNILWRRLHGITKEYWGWL